MTIKIKNKGVTIIKIIVATNKCYKIKNRIRKNKLEIKNKLLKMKIKCFSINKLTYTR